MPTEYWYPTSGALTSQPYNSGLVTETPGGDNSDVRPGGGRAGPMTHDDDTSYCGGFSNGAAGQYESFNADWPSPMATWDGVLTFGMRHRFSDKSGAGSTAYCRLYMASSSPALGGQIVNKAGGPAETAYADTAPIDISVGATYKPGGSAWDVTDFVNSTTIFPTVQMGDAGGGGNLTRSRVTSLWGQISYIPPSGGFSFLLNLAGLGALPFVGHMVDFVQFCSYLDWRRVFHPRHTVMDVEETMKAWRDVREYRWPSFFRIGEVSA